MEKSDASIHDEKYIVVLGSLNMDLVMRTARMPMGGETLHGHGFETSAGGKGANQAVACARLGANVRMIGQVGGDVFGAALQQSLAENVIDIRGVTQCATDATGVAVVLVEDSGQNRILLSAGANGTLTAERVHAHASSIAGASMLVLQLESPLASVTKAMEIAQAAHVPVLLNPAPAVELPDAIWSQVDFLVPNESEAGMLAGFEIKNIHDAYTAGHRFRERGVRHVLITLGSKGVAVIDDKGARHIEVQALNAVDTTAAGDTFIGGLCAGLAEGMALDAAVALGQAASAICVMRHGAQSSIPYRREVSENTLESRKEIL